MYIKKIKDFSLNEIVLISSLPDMGKVGGLVTQHLKKVLNTKDAAKIILHDKPWINQKNGIIEYPIDEYHISVDDEKKIVIFTGNSQPQESPTVIELTNKLLTAVKEFGKIKLVITAGGYLPNDKDSTENIFGVATNTKSLDLLKNHDVGPLNKEVNSITWFNGLILGQAKDNDIDGIGLFGKIDDPESPQYKAASNIVKKIGEILEIKIDTKDLDDKIIEPVIEEEKQSPGIG